MFPRSIARLARLGVATGLTTAAFLTPAGTAAAAQTFTVSAGAESPGGDVQLEEFAPAQVSVNVGDTVTWSLDSTEFHAIAFTGGAQTPDFIQPGPDGVFINPAVAMPSGGSTYDGSGTVGSGLLNKGQKWSLTFSKAGTYNYTCPIHPGMNGSVKVGDAQGADTQAAIDARKAAQVNGELATKAVPLIASNVGEQVTNAGTVGVATGLQSGLVDSLRFYPRRVTIHQNESVSWIWKTEDTPHTVTFLAGGPAPEVVVPQPQPNGPPRLQLNPAVLAPAGENGNWNGGTFLSSGFQQPAPGQPAPQFTVHFDAAGTYDYLCLLHDGMTGTVVVLPND